MAMIPQIFVVMRDGKPTQMFRRIRKRMVDAVIACSTDDAMRLAMERNPLRPNERFQLIPVCETPNSLEMVNTIRARRDAEIDELRELVGA